MLTILKTVGNTAKKIPWKTVGKVVLASIPAISQLKKLFTSDKESLAKKLKKLKTLRNKNEITQLEYDKLKKMLVDNADIKDI